MYVFSGDKPPAGCRVGAGGSEKLNYNGLSEIYQPCIKCQLKKGVSYEKTNERI